MRAIWTAAARRDLLRQFDYVAERNPAAARRMSIAIRQTAEQLAEFPHRGRPGQLEGTREVVVAGFPYLIVYVVTEARVTVLRLLHTAQNWP
jgi:addiction module RelE/StbE family toxin